MAVALRAARCIAYMWQTVPQAIDEGVNDDVAPKADLCEHALMFHMRVRARSCCCARMGVRVRLRVRHESNCARLRLRNAVLS